MSNTCSFATTCLINFNVTINQAIYCKNKKNFTLKQCTKEDGYFSKNNYYILYCNDKLKPRK